jgi:hypothetical protein
MALVTASPAARAQTEETAAVPAEAVARPATDLIDQQLDISLETRDIERILGNIKRASELSKKRISEAAAKSEAVTGALQRGDARAAVEDARATEAMFQEIIRQLEALLAEETPERLRAAQELAEDLAAIERQFAAQFPGVLNPQGVGYSKIDPSSVIRPPADLNRPPGSGGGGRAETSSGGGQSDKEREEKGSDEEPAGDGKQSEGSETRGSGEEEDGEQPGSGQMTEEELRDALAERAEQIAATAQTLEDVLKAITQSTDPADQDAIRKVEAIMKEADFLKALEALNAAAAMIRAGELEDARLAGLDAADRMEILGTRLDAAYRVIVAPQAEELRKIDAALAILRERMEDLETPSQVAAWTREVRELLDRLEELNVGESLINELLEVIQAVGGGGDLNAPAWVVVDGRYAPPERLRPIIIALEEDIQRRLQSLLLGDLQLTSEEAAPPKYRELVERYYEVLSREGSP